ncbi:hypothetical protein RHGRI_032599 [Rhododendron griersonianum]|uniref:PUM-HD domain-containing protein n=1 Tax=Rhododendron griersonianum TaxID=479676 RepID=A0AAV6II90_9ERIC|nr:hypothetical protein RHGRI_032599 [Rhododendron griersonianum]
MERRGGGGEEKEPEWLTVQEDCLAKEDDAVHLEWIPVENHPPENHQFFDPANLSSSPGNHLPSSFENHPFRLYQPEINPYCPANYQNAYSLNGNPSLPNTLCDPNLEAYFSRLNLDPYDQRPSFRSSNDMGFPSPQIRDDDLLRMRVESSVRGQTGLYFDHQNIIQESFLDDFGLQKFDYNYLPNGGQNRNSARNRYPSTIMPHRNQNSSQSANLNSNFGRFGVGLGADNSSFLGYSSSSSSSLHIDHLLKLFTLEELRGNIFLLAKDRDGSKFLWGKIKERKPKDVQMIFLEVRYRASDLMVDRIGNDFIRKFFEVCDQQQITQMLLLVLSDENLMGVCCDLHGTRAMQKLVKQITTKEQRRLVVSALSPFAINLTKNQYGCHVIQDCVQSFPSEDNRHIFRVVADNCVGIGMDKNGCRVLQKCLDYAQGVAKEHLMAEIAANALVLSESQYGNYVVQCILEMRIPHVTAGVSERLAGSYVSLSMNKYGSNVVERCIKLSGEDLVAQIISEMIADPNFLGVLQDPFGNYVAQSALEKSKSHPYGKRVLAMTKSRAANHHRR